MQDRTLVRVETAAGLAMGGFVGMVEGILVNVAIRSLWRPPAPWLFAKASSYATGIMVLAFGGTAASGWASGSVFKIVASPVVLEWYLIGLFAVTATMGVVTVVWIVIRGRP